MTITFENDIDLIVYALEKVIAYARRSQQIFVAQCVWWLASIIGLKEGLITYIDQLRIRLEVSSRTIEGLSVAVEAVPKVTSTSSRDRTSQSVREISVTPRDIQEVSRTDIGMRHIHLDRITQVHNTDSHISNLDLDSPEPCHRSRFIMETKQFTKNSRRERKTYHKQEVPLSRTRSGRVPKQQLTKKQRNRLQAISKDTIAEYLAARK